MNGHPVGIGLTIHAGDGGDHTCSGSEVGRQKTDDRLTVLVSFTGGETQRSGPLQTILDRQRGDVGFTHPEIGGNGGDSGVEHVRRRGSQVLRGRRINQERHVVALRHDVAVHGVLIIRGDDGQIALAASREDDPPLPKTIGDHAGRTQSAPHRRQSNDGPHDGRNAEAKTDRAGFGLARVNPAMRRLDQEV